MSACVFKKERTAEWICCSSWIFSAHQKQPWQQPISSSLWCGRPNPNSHFTPSRLKGEGIPLLIFSVMVRGTRPLVGTRNTESGNGFLPHLLKTQEHSQTLWSVHPQQNCKGREAPHSYLMRRWHSFHVRDVPKSWLGEHGQKALCCPWIPNRNTYSKGFTCYLGFPGGSVVKNYPASAGDTRDSG